jgi:branched-chain amino acid transport system permease protein
MTGVVQHGFDAVSLGALYAMFSLSVAVIFGVARVVNFANGELTTLGGYVIVFTAGLWWPAAIVVAVLAVVVAALAMDKLVFARVRSAPASSLLIISFALSYFIQNIFMLTATSRPKTVNFGSGLLGSANLFGVDVAVLDLVTIGVTIALVGALAYLMGRTPMGRQLRAAAEDFTMARLLGVKANRVIAFAFAISGALAATTGILLTVKTATVTPDFGVTPVTIGFIAVVVGGVGSLRGAAVGGLLIGVVTVSLQVLLPNTLLPFRDAFVFALVIVVLLARPQGLIPSPFAQERI